MNKIELKFDEKTQRQRLYAELVILDCSQPIDYQGKTLTFSPSAFEGVKGNIFDFDYNHNEISELRGTLGGFEGGKLFAIVDYSGEMAGKAKEVLQTYQRFSISASAASATKLADNVLFVEDVNKIEKVAIVTDGYEPVSPNTQITYFQCNFAKINNNNSNKMTEIETLNLELASTKEALQAKNMELAQKSELENKVNNLELQLKLATLENAKIKNDDGIIKIDFSAKDNRLKLDFANTDPVSVADTLTEAKVVIVPAKEWASLSESFPNLAQVPNSVLSPIKDGSLVMEGDFANGTEATVLAGTAKAQFHPKFDGTNVGQNFFGAKMKYSTFDVFTSASANFIRLMQGVSKKLYNALVRWIIIMTTGSHKTIAQFNTAWSIVPQKFVTPTLQNAFDFLNTIMASIGHADAIMFAKQGTLTNIFNDLTLQSVSGNNLTVKIVPASYLPANKDFIICPREAMHGEIGDTTVILDRYLGDNMHEKTIEYLGSAFVPKEYENTVICDTFDNVKTAITV